MIIDKKLEYGFIKRTLMYGGAGICGVSIDSVSFLIATSLFYWLPLSLVNVSTYSLGTLTSYWINKRFSFKSKTFTLSLTRFYLTSILGMLISTAILLYVANAKTGIYGAKIVATTIAVLCQYAINSTFSVVRKK